MFDSLAAKPNWVHGEQARLVAAIRTLPHTIRERNTSTNRREGMLGCFLEDCTEGKF